MVPNMEPESLLMAPPSRREAARRATERLRRRRRKRAQRRREAAVSAAGPERRAVLESLIGDTQTESITAAARIRSLAAAVSVVDPADVVDSDGRDPEVWEHELLQVPWPFGSLAHKLRHGFAEHVGSWSSSQAVLNDSPARTCPCPGSQ